MLETERIACTLHIHEKSRRWHKLRRRVACWLVRLAAWVSPVRIDVSEHRSEYWLG